MTGARSLWAHTQLHVWPERYRLVSLSVEALPDAAAVAATSHGGFAALVIERDEVSLTISEETWSGAQALQQVARGVSGPQRVITFDLDVDLDVSGYLAPAANRLAEAGVPIVPQCGYLKDHLLVREEDLSAAVRVLEDLIQDSRRGDHGE